MSEKLNTLLKDEAFLAKLVSLETDTEVQAFLAENGVELTIAEIAAIKAGVAAQLGENEELSEDDLENVAGGADVADIITGVVECIAKIGDAIHEWTRGRW